MKMTKFVLMTLLAALFMGGMGFAAAPVNYQNFELDTLLHNIEKPGEPIVTEDYIIFTANTQNRSVGIAFDFENYQVIHPFQILSSTDDEGKTTRKHLFYCYQRQHRFDTLKYRLVIDGLWTTDPLNPNREYDEQVNLYFSKLENLGQIRIETEAKDDTVKFIYKGESGLKLQLAGTFTNWDPWIYQLEEIQPGLYELELPLTTGTYYYNYYLGLTPILDNTNPEKIYTADGRSASVIRVN
ncbi:MAG: isoamylase [Treponema sp.]|nr:isoamylase [Treponema sp.]